MYSGVEELVKRYPQYINDCKDDGYTPLHIAAANNHADIVALLAAHVSRYVSVLVLQTITCAKNSYH